MSTTYCFDTNSWVELREKYPFDLFPTLWKSIEALSKKGQICCSEFVGLELKDQDSELYKLLDQWTNSNIWGKTTEEQHRTVREIVNKYPALTTYSLMSSGTDPFTFALAKHLGATLLSFQPKRGLSKSQDYSLIFDSLAIKAINFNELCREQGWRF